MLKAAAAVTAVISGSTINSCGVVKKSKKINFCNVPKLVKITVVDAVVVLEVSC